MTAILTQLLCFAKAFLRRCLTFINRHPKLRRFILAIVHRMLKIPIARSVYVRIAQPIIGSGDGFILTDITQLPLRARRIYADLNDAIQGRYKENG